MRSIRIFAVACSAVLLILVSALAARQPQLGNLEDVLKQKAAEKALGTLLNDQLPLNLDAKTAYPTVTTLPGGPFQPTPLKLTAADLNQPLAPGDYTINVLAFCSEYSVHRAGAGVAYQLAPMQGKAAQAIGALLWRGLTEKNVNPNSLQAVSWGIQSGLRYAQMPKTYQAIIDNVIPDYKSELNGDFVQSATDTYTSLAKGAHLPALDKLLGGMGKPGELMISAERQRAALLRQNTTDEIRTQTLFAGQESGIYTVQKAMDGPWTVRIPGVAYLRYQIAGGNLAANNIIQIRIMPRQTANGNLLTPNRFVNASFRPQPAQPQGVAPTPSNMLQGSIGYSQGTGAQALAPVPVVAPAADVVGRVNQATGNVQLCKPDGTCKPLVAGDTISMGDMIETGADGRTSIIFADNTQITLAAGSNLRVDNYVYDPANNAANRASFNYLQGGFEYVSGLIARKPDAERFDTPVGCLGIRGTQFIMRAMPNGVYEIDLLQGAVATGANPAAPHTQFNAPVKIVRTIGVANNGGVLTQAEYNAIKLQLFPPLAVAMASRK